MNILHWANWHGSTGMWKTSTILSLLLRTFRSSNLTWRYSYQVFGQLYKDKLIYELGCWMIFILGVFRVTKLKNKPKIGFLGFSWGIFADNEKLIHTQNGGCPLGDSQKGWMMNLRICSQIICNIIFDS